ncbi:glycoside hydrolase domain-containing protein [Ferdinandcohnia quinoae]|uniref:DUF1906 domain-containing protein n=1 Tax=Fredinandcohnia quinoae TaxID=2918902 RepID=A0AAW5E2W6_9BACI|nr:glycoside hydrolase domain-containing protein [Fredinandcohnia sp. SECRCQ15]MCH1626713.1 DUF1906 domain-containing protein [Fredinandcohnia sp. SECRCQ15]
MKERSYNIILSSVLVILASLAVFFFLNEDEKVKSASSDTNHTTETSTNSSNQANDVNITINNNIQNNIQGDGDVTVNTAITNNISDASKAAIDNSITNSGDGSGTAKVTNTIENLLKGNATVTLNNIIENSFFGSATQFENNLQNNFGDHVEANVKNEVGNNQSEGSSNEDAENNKGNNNDGNKEDKYGTKPDENLPEVVWGIDSASETTEEFYACVKENFGDPVVFGRYIGDIEGVSNGLTAEQVKLIHSKGDYILPIYNHFDNATGYDNGVKQAKEAIKLAKDLGIPEGVAIFADIEPNYPVDSKFITGWYETIETSQYESGIYGVFDPEQKLYDAYNAAAKSNDAISDNNYIWTAAPNNGITTQDKAPEFKPQAPEGSKAFGWQYGLDADTCNIDTNLFKKEIVNVLWGSK